MPEEKTEQPFHRERLNLPDKDEQQKLNERKRKQLVQDLAVCFNSPAGFRVLRYLMDITGYKRSKVGANTTLGMDIMQGTLYNSARELVMIELLEFIPVYILKKVDFGAAEELEE